MNVFISQTRLFNIKGIQSLFRQLQIRHNSLFLLIRVLGLVQPVLVHLFALLRGSYNEIENACASFFVGPNGFESRVVCAPQCCVSPSN